MFLCVSKVQQGQHTASDGSSVPSGQLLLKMPQKDTKERKRERDKEGYYCYDVKYILIYVNRKSLTRRLNLANTFHLIILVIH